MMKCHKNSKMHLELEYTSQTYTQTCNLFKPLKRNVNNNEGFTYSIILRLS